MPNRAVLRINLHHIPLLFQAPPSLVRCSLRTMFLQARHLSPPMEHLIWV